MEPKQFSKGMAITKQKQTHRYREQMSGSQHGKGWGVRWGKSIQRYKLVSIKRKKI